MSKKHFSLAKRLFSNKIFHGKSFVLSRMMNRMIGIHNVENSLLFEALIQEYRPSKDRNRANFRQ